MKYLSLQEFTGLLNSGEISPYSIYDLDLDYQQHYSIKHYLENSQDNLDKDQPINILFQDIEVYSAHANQFPKVNQARFPISAITIYSTFDKIFYSYFLLQHVNVNLFPSKEELPKLAAKFKDELVKNKYINEDEKIVIQTFNSEIDLIKTCWGQIKAIDPSVLSGWNSDEFDLPYTYFRLSELLNKNEAEVGRILSQFGKVKILKYGENFMINIPEYPVLDLMYAYKPRDDGGLNYGSKQASYSLDWVSNAELSLKKLEYKSEGMSLDQLYDKDPVTYLLYNIIDVALVKNMNHKLRHIESHNLLRRLMKTSFTNSLRGSTALFDTFVNYQLNLENNHVRFGIIEETALAISEQDLYPIYIPKSMNRSVKDVDLSTVRSITGRFPGAYVKNSKAQVVTAKDGIIIDLDASSLYPSMINQLNISFDTFYGKIIDPLTYNFLSTLQNFLGTNNKIPTTVHVGLYGRIVKYVNRLSPQNKTEYIQYCYLIVAYLINKLENSKKTLQQLYNPSSVEDYIVLKRYLLPLLDLIDDTHEESKEYNSFCHEYLVNNSIPDPNASIFIAEDILQPTLKINKLPVAEFEQYLKSKNLVLSLSGCLFTKQEQKSGLFIEFLKNLKNLRNEYEKKRDSFSETSDEYSFYDMRQKAIKITMNTTYGLFGQSTYRFSNKHLAKTITVQGRLTLKIAQIISDMYLQNLKI